MKFSDFLQAELDKRDWSNARLAAVAKLSRQAVGYYLTGDRIPDRKSLKKIADALNLPLDLLNDYAEGGGKPKPAKDTWLLKVEHKLTRIKSPEARKVVEATIDALQPDNEKHRRIAENETQ